MKRVFWVGVVWAFAMFAEAGEHRYGPYPVLYGKECASCHVAYPPELMTAAGWRQVMQQLGKHYGTDASLDAGPQAEISAFLERYASRRAKHAPTEASARLSRSNWFVHEHGLTPPPKVSFARCEACHTGAEQQDYSERSLRLPAGYRKQGD